MSIKFAVTDIAHPALRDVRVDCAECLELGELAASHARVLGSAIGTYASGSHHATVKRVIALITLSA